MRRRAFTLVLLAATAGALPAGSAVTVPEKAETVLVELKTSQGTIILELNPEKAPGTVRNFLGYLRRGHYRNTVFHRVVPEFVIQGGGLTSDLEEKPTRKPIPNEAGNGLSNQRGTVAMARTSDPDSATCQFYINLKDNTRLDRERAPDKVGYCVFGKVVRGLDVVDKIAGVETRTASNRMSDVPKTPVIILSAKVIEKLPER